MAPEVQKLLIGLKPEKSAIEIAKALSQESAVIITGAIWENHPDAALLRTLTHLLAEKTGSKIMRLTSGSNSAGAWMAGMVPHRGECGKPMEAKGLDVQAALDAKLKAYVLLAVEPGSDFANPYRTSQSLLGAEFVVMLTAFQGESIQDYADVILPIAPYAETSGTYINVDGTWQTVKGALSPHGESRPAWKVLRVLANLLQCKGFDYQSTEDVLSEVKAKNEMTSLHTYTPFYPESLPAVQQELVRIGEWPLYRCDSIVRHSKELQLCAAADTACVRINPATVKRLKLGETATISQGHIEITLPLKQDERVAIDAVWVANALPETADLGHAFAAITIKS